jgi:hypothetical protein
MRLPLSRPSSPRSIYEVQAAEPERRTIVAAARAQRLLKDRAHGGRRRATLAQDLAWPWPEHSNT